MPLPGTLRIRGRAGAVSGTGEGCEGMTDRIRCNNCGSESYASGATLFCAKCYRILMRRIEHLETALAKIAYQDNAPSNGDVDTIWYAEYAEMIATKALEG